jgi:hypothetical protein
MTGHVDGQVSNSLVARRIGIISAAWRVICCGSGSTDGSSTDGSAYRHPGAYTTVITSTVNAAAIYTTVINANTSSIIRRGLS